MPGPVRFRNWQDTGIYPDHRQNSSELNFAPTPATITACWSCSSWSSAQSRWRSAAIGNWSWKTWRCGNNWRPSTERRDVACGHATELFWMVLARSWRNWLTALIVVHPDTVIRWHRDWLRRRWTRRSRRRHDGRPPIDQQIRALVREMATANPLWGAPRIHGELRTLGVDVSERTVSRLLEPHTRPSPQTWKTFLTNHLASAASMDFFTVPTLTGRVLFVVIVLSHRPSPHRAFQHHEASHSRVDPPTSRRRIPGRHRAQMVASRSRQRLRRELPASTWRAWASPKWSQPPRVPGRIRSRNA